MAEIANNLALIFMKNTRKQYIMDILGWYGVTAVLVAYALVSFQLISAPTLIYNILNLTGAIGIIVEAQSKKDYPAVSLNIIWAIIAIISILVNLPSFLT